MKVFRRILFILIILVLVVFALQNMQTVPFYFLTLNTQSIPVFGLVLLSAIMGYILGVLHTMFIGNSNKKDKITSTENNKENIKKKWFGK